MPEPVPDNEVYDPYELELKQLADLGASEIQLDFTDPQVARFLAQQSAVRLSELRVRRSELGQLQTKYDQLRDDKEERRVRIAGLEEKYRTSWIEFPAGIFCGVAGNLIVTDPTSVLAWGMMIFGLLLFVILRQSHFASVIRQHRSGGTPNA